MKHMSLGREYARYVSLNILGMLGLSFYIIADTFFVAQGLGTDGLAALNLAIPAYSFIHGTALLLGMGGATRFAVAKGQKECGRANRIFTNTLQITGAAAVVFMLLGLFCSGFIARILGAEGAVLDMTRTYLRVLLLFSPAFLYNEVLLSFVRNDGAPQLAMCGMLVGSLCNIVLDYILVFPMGMGILGAVLATACAPLISMGILSVHWIKGKSSLRLEGAAFSLRDTGQTAALGLPSLLTELSSGVVIMVFNMLMLKLQGNVGVAAYGVIANLSLVVIAIYTGIAQGNQPLLSRAYGGMDQAAIRKLMRYAIGTVLVISIFVYMAFFLWADPIVGIFNSEGDAGMQQMAVSGMHLYFLGIPFAGCSIAIAVYFTSVCEALPAHMIALLRGFILILPSAFLLSAWFGVNGVWLAFPAAEFLTGMISAVLYIRRTEKKNYMVG